MSAEAVFPRGTLPRAAQRARADVGGWNGRVTTAEEEQDRSRDAIRFRERRPHGEARSLGDDAAAVETDERAGIRMAGGDERGQTAQTKTDHPDAGAVHTRLS